ncbi:UDP-N-acetyl-D-mannosamine dehydrogenase [compost metagenome]
MHPGQTLAVEPNIVKLPENAQKKLHLVLTEPAIAESDIVILLVDHKDFKNINQSSFSDKRVIDTRGIW